MKIAIKKTQIEGQLPNFSLEINGVEWPISHEASRQITKTTYEDDHGVFQPSGAGVFFRCPNDSTLHSKDHTPWVEVDFLGEINDDLTAQEYCELIAARAEQVKKAFAEKYPAVDEVFEMEV